jgi:hypothetical protein
MREAKPEDKKSEDKKSPGTIDMTFRDVSIMRRIPQELPTPGSWENIDNPNNKYRPVITDYGLFNAMYLMDENGVPGWYTSYAEKLIIPVKSWIEIFDKK